MTRWLRIAVRTVHLGAMAFVLVGAFDGALAPGAVTGLLLSGGYLVADNVRRHGADVFRYLNFWVVVAKAMLFVALFALPSWAGPLAVVALVLGSGISHAPGWVRQYALVGEPGPCAARSGSAAAGDGPDR
jgi:hypothetical protein